MVYLQTKNFVTNLKLTFQEKSVDFLEHISAADCALHLRSTEGLQKSPHSWNDFELAISLPWDRYDERLSR